MLSKADLQHTEVGATIDGVAPKAVELIVRRIWLPKFLYDSLPWFYLLAGIMALMATLYINAWFWILPHYFLFSAACLHLSVIVFRRRRPRKNEPGSSATDT